jgi:hypothetical protein
MMPKWIGAIALGLAMATPVFSADLDDEVKMKLADCPAAVKKALELEAKGSRIEEVGKLTEEGQTTYAATVVVAGKHYQVEVDDKGGLVDMSLDPGDDEVAFGACPAAVQATFRKEAHDAKFDVVGRDLRYGVTVYEAVVSLGGKDYSLVVAQNGTLVEKMLVIAEDDIELSHCPVAVQNSLREHARDGKIGVITRSTGIAGHVFQAEIEMGGKGYMIEVTEGGGLISKSLLEQEK